MSFDWPDYLALASNLHADGGNAPLEDAKYRASISRAYYAVFCVARNLVRDEGSARISKTGEDHETVRKAYATHGDERRRKIALHLVRLRSYRSQADYDDVVPGLAKLSEHTLIAAKAALDKLSKL